MTKPLLIVALVSALALSSGCFFSKKGSKPKESNAIASETEETYRKRWVDKRAAELTAQGVAADTARTQADNEFTAKYGFNSSKK